MAVNQRAADADRTREGVRLAPEHLDTLREATPYRLDDATVAGVIRTWEVTRDYLDLTVRRAGPGWQQEARGTRHEGNVKHYCALAAEERGLVEEVLALAHRLASVTIEKLLAKSDLDVGVEALLGGPPGWGVPQPDVRTIAPRRPDRARIGID